jgi:UPF0755 protein
MTARRKGPPRPRRRRRRKSDAGSGGPSPEAPAGATPAVRLLATARRYAWVVAVAVGVAALAASTWLFVLYPNEKGPGDGHTVEIVVPRNAAPGDLARILASAGLLSNPRLFAFWVRVTGGTRGVVAGMHLLTDDASPRELMARLERHPRRGHTRVTFPEGWTRFDMARRLQDRHVVSLRAFLDATTDADVLRELGIEGDSAEGFLFPATYDLSLDGDARDVVRTMKREFDRRWDIVSRAHSASLNDVMTSAQFGVRDVVILASMVEKETGVDEDRPIVASVFLNRLRDPKFTPKRLECDPTAAYGCLVAPERASSCAGFTGKPTAAIEHDADNPYSTYTHEGLPPGPIANPGAKSLEAAMAPASTRYFFFVARPDGRSRFSETLAEHSGAVHADAGRRLAGP